MNDIKKKLKKSGIKQKDFAAKCNVTPAQMSAWLGGKRNPTRTTKLALNLMLDIMIKENGKG